MTRPGDRLRAIASRIFSPKTMERVIDPIVADIQREHADAVTLGQTWRSRWIRFAGFIGFVKVVGLCAVRESPTIHAAFTTLAATTLVTILAAYVSLQHSRVTPELVLYILPGALAISLPVGVAAGLTSTLATVARRNRGAVLALAAAMSFIAFLNLAWLVPAANQRYRTLAAGRWVARGTNELTIGELRQRIREKELRGDSREALTLRLWYHARWALSAAPLALTSFALAVVAAQRRRFYRLQVGLILTIFVGCYILFPRAQVEQLLQWLPPIGIAWIPNAIAAAAALTVLATDAEPGSSSPRSTSPRSTA